MTEKTIINFPTFNININVGDCQGKDEGQNLLPYMEEAQSINKHIKKCFCGLLEGSGEREKLLRVKDCANTITFRYYKDIDTKKLDSINLCRERLCLNCCVALARKNCGILEKVLASYGKQLYFITLTIKNVPGVKLKESISLMNKAFTGFVRAERLGNFYKSVEVTYNEKSNTYHPHIHFITDKKLSKSYLNNAWAKWYSRKADCHLKWLSCNIKAITDIFSTCCELNKYITKPMNITDKTIEVFYKQLKGLRLHSSGGELKKRVAEAKNTFEKEKLNTEEFLSSHDYEILKYIYNGENYIQQN